MRECVSACLRKTHIPNYTQTHILEKYRECVSFEGIWGIPIKLRKNELI